MQECFVSSQIGAAYILYLILEFGSFGGTVIPRDGHEEMKLWNEWMYIDL